MTSMTGYAYEERTFDEAVVSVEIKSVNSRFLDLEVFLPSYLASLESYYRQKIAEKVNRGKVCVNIRIRELSSGSEIYADVSLAASYYNAIKKISEEIGMKGEIPLSLIISQNGVLNAGKSYDVEKYRGMIDELFLTVLEKFCADRKREGESLYKDLSEKLAELQKCATFFKGWQPKMESAFREQITEKFKEIVGDAVDENRIMTEIAALLIKYTINEEIVRLQSHIDAMSSEMKNNPIPGKKLDFICQEMNREINTIGSKNQFSEVGAMVISAKEAVENIREQSKNVE